MLALDECALIAVSTAGRISELWLFKEEREVAAVAIFSKNKALQRW
jgi:hypothetical protein